LITTEKGTTFEARAVLVSTGSRRRKLAVPGADTYDGKGIVYCASCDGPLFQGLDVAVIGGGNAGFETAAQLTEYATSVTLFERNEKFKADPITVEKVLAHPNMKALTGVEILGIHGEKTVTGISYKEGKAGESTRLPVGGVFVEIGQIPNTEFIKDLVKVNEFGCIVIDPRTQQTSLSGIWAAGDNTDVLYHQNNIAAGDAVRAIEDIYRHLKTK
jgi:alkyl hydroperoxide reductase subunit AhpF